MNTIATPPVVRLEADKNLDRSINLARLRAKKEGATVFIEKGIARRDGSIRRIPILEVTPQGDVLEVPAATLRTPIAQQVLEQDIVRHQGGLNARATRGHDRLVRVITDSMNYLKAATEHRLALKQRQHQQRPRVAPGTPAVHHSQEARANRHTTTLLSERAARKTADQAAADKTAA